MLTSLTYARGPLGNYYQTGTNVYYQNGTNLVDKGSRTASAAGLYHYTSVTNQTIEAQSTVDIGPHYMALDSTGTPVDTDGDGLPDYVEDANGNGAQDTNETSMVSADTDGDGLPDYEEVVLIGVTWSNPLLSDTDGDNVIDSLDDIDGDLISNKGELTWAASDPKDMFSLNRALNGNAMTPDGRYLLCVAPAPGQTQNSLATLSIGTPPNPATTLRFILAGATGTFTYDIWWRPGFGIPWQLYFRGTPNQTTFDIPIPKSLLQNLWELAEASPMGQVEPRKNHAEPGFFPSESPLSPVADAPLHSRPTWPNARAGAGFSHRLERCTVNTGVPTAPAPSAR